MMDDSHETNIPHRKLRTEELHRIPADEYVHASLLPAVLLVDNVRSLWNVGSLFRTADAFSLERVVLGGYTGRPPRREIHASALGAEVSMPWIHVPSAIDAVVEYRERGYRIIALEQCTDSVDIACYSLGSPRPFVLIVGNEVSGVQQELLSACDDCIEIAQRGTKHSMNVSTAAAVALWKLTLPFNGLKS